MLAMSLRRPRGVRFPALSLTIIASVLAPTGGPDAAMGCRVSRVIVDDHRERARSYSGPEVGAGCQVSRVIVGDHGPTVCWCQLLSL
jgi:hypothetical protein